MNYREVVATGTFSLKVTPEAWYLELRNDTTGFIHTLLVDDAMSLPKLLRFFKHVQMDTRETLLHDKT